MGMRSRILAVLEAKPHLTIRGVSLAAGLSDSMLNKFLKGHTDSMTVKNAEALAMALGVDPVWLVFGEGDPDEASSIAGKIERLSEQNRQLIERLIDELPRTGTDG